MFRIIGIGFIYFIGIELAGILAIGLFLFFLVMLRRAKKLSVDGLEEYFKNMNELKLIFMVLGFYEFSLVVTASGCNWLFRVFQYTYNVPLSIGFVMMGTVYFGLYFMRHKKEMYQKLYSFQHLNK